MLYSNCGQCVYHNSGACAVLQTETKDEQSCPFYSSVLYQCSICNSAIAPQSVIFADTNILCPSCYSKKNTCLSCSNAESCAFEEDTSCDLPKTIIHTRRQGPMVIQEQVRNPERATKLCSSCPCYIEGECARSREGVCGQYLRKY